MQHAVNWQAREMKYKLIIFDIDGTITTHISSWRYIHERMGLWDHLAKKYQDEFLAGKISYRKFCELDAACWKGMREERLKRIFKKVKFTKNAKSCLKRLKQEIRRYSLSVPKMPLIPEANL